MEMNEEKITEILKDDEFYKQMFNDLNNGKNLVMKALFPNDNGLPFLGNEEDEPLPGYYDLILYITFKDLYDTYSGLFPDEVRQTLDGIDEMLQKFKK